MRTHPLASLFARRKTTARRRTATFRPSVEGLEDRLTPAVTSVNQDLVNRVATVTANDAADSITITDPGSGSVTVSGTGIPGTQALDSRIRTIKVVTNGGADVVRYKLTGTVIRGVPLVVDVDLGSNNDVFAADLNGKNLDNSSSLNLKVQGGSGSDLLTVDAEGTPDDRVHVRSGSTLRLELLGGSDLDPFDSADAIDVKYRGELDGTLILKAVGGRGGDTITALVTLNAGSTGRVKGDGTAAARVEGGQGADELDFRVRDNSDGTAGVSAVIDAGLDWDHDAARHTSNVTADYAFGDENIAVT